MKIYSIKNEITGTFNAFIYSQSDADIKSVVMGSIAQDSSMGLYRLSDNLGLYCFGEIDFIKGHLKAYKTPYYVCCLSELKPFINFDDVINKECDKVE